MSSMFQGAWRQLGGVRALSAQTLTPCKGSRERAMCMGPSELCELPLLPWLHPWVAALQLQGTPAAWSLPITWEGCALALGTGDC